MSPSLLLPILFQYSVLITLVLLLIDHHEEKKERRGRDVLDDACHLIHKSAPTVRSQVQAVGPNAPARWGAPGPQHLVVAARRPVHRTRQRVLTRHVAEWPTVREKGLLASDPVPVSRSLLSRSPTTPSAPRTGQPPFRCRAPPGPQPGWLHRRGGAPVCRGRGDLRTSCAEPGERRSACGLVWRPSPGRD